MGLTERNFIYRFFWGGVGGGRGVAEFLKEQLFPFHAKSGNL